VKATVSSNVNNPQAQLRILLRLSSSTELLTRRTTEAFHSLRANVLPGCRITALSHYCAILLPCYHITVLSHYPAIAVPRCRITVLITLLPYYRAVALPCYRIIVLSHYPATILPYCRITMLPYNHTTILPRHCDSVQPNSHVATESYHVLSLQMFFGVIKFTDLNMKSIIPTVIHYS
jgi:hypothetical protein